MKKINRVYELEAEKKHSVRYREVNGGREISGTIYLSKEVVGHSNFPDRVMITVEEVEA